MSKNSHDKGRKPQSHDHSWEWRELHFADALTPDAATVVLERIATAPELGTIALEVRADANGARWLIATRSSRLPDLKQVLTTHLAVRLLKPRRVRAEMGLTAKLHLTGSSLATGNDSIKAVVRGLFGALAALTADEQLTLQLLLGQRIAPREWAQNAAPGWVDFLLGAPPQPRRQPGPKPSRSEQHGFHATLRIGAAGSIQGRLHHLINQARGALRGLETSESRLKLVAEHPTQLEDARVPWRWPLKLRSGELAALTAWPIGDPPLPLFGDSHPRMLIPKRTLTTDGRIIGALAAPGYDEHVAIPIRDAAFHTHLLGPTGSGKSTLMRSLIEADIRAGRSVLVIDPKGDLATDVLARIPAERRDEVVVIDPTSPSPVGFNPLAGSLAQAPVTADTLLGIFESLFKENWGIRTADVLSAAFLTLARTPGANLLWLQPLLTDPAFRRKVLEGQHDPLGTDAFWRQYDAKKPEAQSVEIAPVLNKLRQLILRPGLRAVLGQTEPRFDIGDLFTKRRIVIVNLNRGLIGSDAAKLLGTLLTGQLWTKLLARQSTPQGERRIVSIFIDEVHDFISGLPGDLSDALAQARSLGGAFTLAHQYRAQLSPSMLQAVETNTRNKVYFGMSGIDATQSAKHMPGVDAQDLMLLPAYHAYTNVMQDGHQTGWITIKTAPPSAPLVNATEVYAASHVRYGIPAEQTEAEILSLIDVGHQTDTEDPEPNAPIGRVKR